MKRTLTIIGFAAHAAGAMAQSSEHPVEISPFWGIQSGIAVQSPSGRLEIDAASSYGVLVDIRVRPDATIQIAYDRQDTSLDFQDDDPFAPTRVRADLTIEYYHFGGAVEFKQGPFRPYFALTVGATRFDPDASDVSDEWRFSVGAGLGFKAYVTPRFGLRIDGRAWPTFVQTSGGFLCGGGGCLVSIEADFLTQAIATAGLFLTF